jgi:hypothetical protein
LQDKAGFRQTFSAVSSVELSCLTVPVRRLPFKPNAPGRMRFFTYLPEKYLADAPATIFLRNEKAVEMPVARAPDQSE